MDRRAILSICSVLVILIVLQMMEYRNELGLPSNPAPKRYSYSLAQKTLPECKNLLKNITQGRWLKKTELEKYRQQWENLTAQEDVMQSVLMDYWVKSGIQTAFWREDFRCGYKNFQNRPPKSRYRRVGSWCDARGDRPCCSNNFNGTCMTPSDATCNCDGCVDLRKYVYPETCEWTVSDDRCKWKDYDAAQICDVIERSPFHDIHYFGDSFMRNMFRTLSAMITNDLDYGGISASAPADVKERCKNMQQFFWAICRHSLHNISDTFHPENLCGGRGYMNFTVKYHEALGTVSKTRFLNLVRSKINVTGSLIVLGVGFHMQCKSQIVIKQYLGPAVNAITKVYGPPLDHVNTSILSGRWPKIVFCLPPSIGLLKPPEFLSRQNDIKCGKYNTDMKLYADEHDISVINISAITRNVHSFDGAHFTFGVNRLKNLILLNYIELLKYQS